MEMTFEMSIMTFIANSVVFVLLAGFITKKINKLDKFKDSFAYLGLKKDENFKKNILIGLVVAVLIPFIQLVGMAIVGTVVGFIMDISLTDILKVYYASIAESEIGMASLAGKIIVAVSMIGFVGVGEEIFFRGLIQKLSISKFGKTIGLGLTAILFTLLHGFYMFELPVAIISATSLLIISIIFGALKEKTNSLIPSIIAHGVGNAIVYTIGANLLYNLL